MSRVLALAVWCMLVLLVNPSAAQRPQLQPDLANKFNHAVTLLDGYSGNSAELETARAELQSVLAAVPRFAPAHREMARYFINRGHISGNRFQPGALEAADASLRTAIEIEPKYAEAFVLKGHLYERMRRLPEANEALKTAENLGTKDPWLDNNWGDLLRREGKFEESARRYRKVLDSKTANKRATAGAYEGLISVYRYTGKLEEADDLYRKLIAFEPGGAWNYGNYAEFLLCAKDDFEASIARSREALRIMNYGAGRYWLAAALYRKWANSALSGDLDKDRQSFDEAKSLAPEPVLVAMDHGNCPPLKQLMEALRQLERRQVEERRAREKNLPGRT